MAKGSDIIVATASDLGQILSPMLSKRYVRKTPRKKSTTTPNRVSAELDSKTAEYVRKKMREKGTIKKVLEDMIRHNMGCPLA